VLWVAPAVFGLAVFMCFFMRDEVDRLVLFVFGDNVSSYFV